MRPTKKEGYGTRTLSQPVGEAVRGALKNADWDPHPQVQQGKEGILHTHVQSDVLDSSPSRTRVQSDSLGHVPSNACDFSHVQSDARGFSHSRGHVQSDDLGAQDRAISSASSTDRCSCLSKTGVQPYPLNLATWRFGLVQMALLLLLPTNYLPSWKVDVSQGHDVAEIPSQPRGSMTFLLMRPRRNCHAIDEDGKTWYDDSILAMPIWLGLPAIPMAGVTVLTSPSRFCTQSIGLGHALSEALALSHFCTQSIGLGHVLSEALALSRLCPCPE
ncbi:hypothetical protein Pyn_38983 [Prunus yedoensis var. nudiflora]|uniref:Uncharacterized protein n=1 Tax=Prunus yedoensis var. nudiflora TaxID=2094558 RepID=A0A314Z8G7_PRUYE|nr:hypothetical protein Pyn_38983 [Prunus yedoensis var. nudiflora]